MAAFQSPNNSGSASSGALFAHLAGAGIVGAAGVALAAVAAHRVESPALATAATMLVIHAAAAVGLLAVSATLGVRAWRWIATLMLGAVALFSGTIAANTMNAFSAPVMLAPIGGSLLIASWLAVAVLAIIEWRRGRAA